METMTMEREARPVTAHGVRHPVRGAGSMRAVGVLWMATLGLATLGAWTIWMAMPGLNWGLWTSAAGMALLFFARMAGKPLDESVLIPVGLACALALGTMFTADEGWHGLIAMLSAALLATATLFAAGHAPDRAGPIWLVFAPVLALLHTIAEVLRRLGEAIGLVRADRSMPVLRGIAIAAPVVIVFGLLLSGVDPTLERWREALGALLETIDWIPRMIFFSMLGTISLGALGLALRDGDAQERRPDAAPRIVLGVTERTILLGSVAALFALFLGLQLSYLFGNAPAVRGSGVTFAEHARRGFGELTVVATLCTVLILLTDRHAKRGAGEERVRVTQLVVVAELQLLLASAFHRVLLYEEAYGFTSARLYAKVYMVVMSLMLVVLAWEIWSRIDGRRLIRRGAVVGATALTVLTFWNHDAWIASKNLRRYMVTGKLDVRYLGAGLSANALPTVVSALPRLAPDEASALRTCLHQRYWNDREYIDGPRWYEWNLRREQARRALASTGIDLAAKPAPTVSLGASEPRCRYVPG